MSIAPIITFKAGICDVDQTSKPYKVRARPTPGYIYLYSEDDLIHFCWRPRSVPLDQPEIDLVMVPTDGNFLPYDTRTPSNTSSKTNGRIFSLKFLSSSQRHLFWLQSKPQGRDGDPAWMSPRDLKLGEIVNKLLQGEEVDVNRELASVRNNNDNDRRDGDDAIMEDADGRGDSYDQSTGGAGADATGGDIRREGEDAREGGADGARAAGHDAAAVAVRNFLASLEGPQGLGGSRTQSRGKLYPSLNDLLDSNTTVSLLENADAGYIDNLMSYLPPAILVPAKEGENGDRLGGEPGPESVKAAREAMSLDQKRALLKRVLLSPQFSQGLASLTVALRDGGLPSISEALGVQVENGGRIRGGNVPLGGGDAVEAFVEGVKRMVQQTAEMK